jgi:hypothetical protein
VKLARALAALAAFAVPAGIYMASASVEPASWDTAELQGVPYVLGISHPTGFPLYVLLGYPWSHLFALGSIAWRMNAMSGAAMGVACAAAYGVALEFGASIPVALLATLWFGFTQDIWGHANRAEAQDLAVACAAVAIYAFVRWLHEHRPQWFALAFALAGLGMAAHPNALWVLPAFVLGGLIAHPRPSGRLVAASFGLVVAALALYLYLPLRSLYVIQHHLDPTAALAGVGGGIFWNYNNPSTIHGLARELAGTETQTPQYFLASFNPVHLQATIWTFISTIREQYDASVVLLLVGGFIVAWRRDWRATLVVTLACAFGLLFSVVYPNESDVGRYRMLVLWLAVPLLGALTPSSRRGFDEITHALLIFYLAAGVTFAFGHERSFFRHAPGEGGRWVISAVRPYVPPGAVVVTGWLDATSLAYGAYVDGSLPGRIIVSDDRLDVPEYRTWAAARRVFVLVNPNDVGALRGASDYATLDPYHELYEVHP